jgi:hypothetical protein
LVPLLVDLVFLRDIRLRFFDRAPPLLRELDLAAALRRLFFAARLLLDAFGRLVLANFPAGPVRFAPLDFFPDLD